MTRLPLAALALFAASSAVAVSPEWIAVSGAEAGTVFVDRASTRMSGDTVTIQVLRSHDDPVNLGVDPATEAPMYSHRSVKLNYAVDCEGQKIALQSWEMFSGNLGHGEVVWADRYAGAPVFADASTTEEKFAYASACASKWAMLQ